ncbi:MAG: DEAD/DEAH box helicase [Crocinitomicaceae bacterium]|nr:DEAD/DEAH box helicase [Crocinitomicaceae bacterium]
MKFSDYRIDAKIKSQLEYMGFKKPTDIQYRCIPHILNGEDVMAVAPTGTGKTAAFVIPIINQLLKSKRKGTGIRALILVPTRELAKQIAEVIDLIGIKTGVSSLGLYGGVEQDSQITALEKRLDVLVATPGRMFDLISQGFIKLDRIECFVIDEADLMLDLGFNKDIQDVLKFLPKRRQTLFFTATVNKKIKSLAYDVVRNAIRIHVSPKNPVSKNVQHAVSFVEMDDKRFFLENLLKEFQDGKFIVFVRTKVRVERVVAAMNRVGVATEALHGGLDQKNRFSILDRFRKGETNILITTDVACRGIDVPEMDYVINYDLPDNPENYVHRCGRTGRGNKKGHAISFCAENEKSFLIDIENYTGNEIERFEISPSDYKDIVSDSGTEDDWQSMISKNSNPDSWE